MNETNVPSHLRFLLERRSVSALAEPGPSDDEIGWIVRAAMTVPDHGQLRPYRFVVVRSAARDRFGEALAAAALEERPDLSPGIVDKLRKKAFAAPAQIVLVASPREGMKIPEWEQVASASCTGFAVVLAAHALGLGAVWKSAAALDGRALRELFAMQTTERLLGWINLGRASVDGGSRPPSDPTDFVRVLGTSGLEPLSS